MHSIRRTLPSLPLCVLSVQLARIWALQTSIRQKARSDGAVTTVITLPRSTGAACLDGSPFAFQILKGRSDKWTFRLGGGGQCEDEKRCYVKTTGTQEGTGSSLNITWDDPVCFNRDQEGNKLDCTLVNMLYCDGGYYTGYRDEPHVMEDGFKLYLRGRRNLEAAIDILVKEHGLGTADELVVQGHSSGGLATILNLDHIAARVPLVRVHGVPDSGFTIDHADREGKTSYMDKIKQVYEFHNSSEALSSACVKHYPSTPWFCMVSQYITPFIATPLFVLNSQYDPWQMTTGIYGLSYRAIWHGNYVEKGLEPDVLKYGEYFLASLQPFLDVKQGGKQIHAAFITSCICHAECQFFDQKWGDEDLALVYGRWSQALNASYSPGAYIESPRPNYGCLATPPSLAAVPPPWQDDHWQDELGFPWARH